MRKGLTVIDDTATGADAPRAESPTGMSLTARRHGVARRSSAPSALQLGCAAAAVLTVLGAAVLPLLTARGGYFTTVQVPVYTEPVDGWGCHLFGDCQTLHTSPDPTYTLHDARSQHVTVQCVLGNFHKISHPVQGWVPEYTVRTAADPIGCNAGEF